MIMYTRKESRLIFNNERKIILKIKLEISEQSFKQVEDTLLKLGFELSDDAEYILIEKNRYSNYISCRSEDTSCHILTKDIIFIESMGHDITLHTKEKPYKCSENLTQLEKFLNPNEFIRISKSVIISKSKVKAIRAGLSQKFLVTMSNDAKVDVTRSYYHIFRNAFGI